MRTILSVSVLIAALQTTLPADEVEATAAIVDARGGSVSRDESQPSRPVVGVILANGFSDDDLALLGAFPDLRELGLYSPEITSRGIRQLRQATPHLKALRIANSPLGSNGFREIVELRELTKLSLTGAMLSGEDLAELPRLRHLTSLSLERCPITDVGLKHIVQVRTLKVLETFEVGVTKQGIRPVATLPALEEFTTNCPQFDDEALHNLAGCRSLKRIELTGARVTDSGLKELTRLPKLEMLGLAASPVTPAAATAISRLKALKGLDLAGTRAINAPALARLSTLPNLEYLALIDAWPLDDADLAAFAKFPKLERLTIGGRRLTDNGLMILAELHLSYLAIGGPLLTDAGVERLRGALPQAEVRRWDEHWAW
jgi:hypothetical protein